MKPKRLGVRSRSGYALPKADPQPLILIDAEALIIVAAGHQANARGRGSLSGTQMRTIRRAHNHEVVWGADGKFAFSLSGLLTSTEDGTDGAAFTASSQNLLLNLAIDNGFFSQHDATTDAALPLFYDIDHVRLAQTN